jgi:hypothetical protein
MTPDRDDPIIDSSLEELLGGRTPPDLTARILQAWAAKQGETAAWHDPIAPPSLIGSPSPMEPLAPPIQGHNDPIDTRGPLSGDFVSVRSTSTGRREHRLSWPSVAVSAAILLMGAAVGGIAYYGIAGGNGTPIVQGPGKANADKQGTGERAPQNTVASSANEVVPAERPREDQTRSSATEGSVADRRPVRPLNSDSSQAPSADLNATAKSPRRDPSDLQVEPQYVSVSSDKEIVAFSNDSLAATWKENEVKPAEPATDAEWCRRLYLRVVGRIPTLEEARNFLDDKSPSKREKLVTQLLTSREYTEQYARHWATIWSNLLIGRTGGSEGLASREGLSDYLAQSLQQNKPYNRIVYELLTATGASKPGTADYNGAVNFLLAGMKDDAALATGRTTRVFLGQQVQCAQCHNHPTADWSQGHFWAMNSFFRQMKAEKTPDAVKLVDTDYVSASGDVEEAQVYYQLPSGELKAAFPKLPDGTAVSPSGLLSEVNRREELARWIVKSEELPQAYVNRMWSHFFGYGFTRPVDDMGSHNQAVHGEILDRLSKEFVASGYDMKSVVRWISLSDPFSRSSKIPPGQLASADMPELGTAPLFSHYYARQMQVEEVYDSLLIAAKLRNAAGSSPDLQQAKIDWLAQFNRPMGTDDGSEETHFDGSIRQSIIMMNGDLMKRAVSSEHEGLLRSVTASNMKVSEKLEHLFLAALSRKPTRRELEAAQTIVTNAGRGKEAQALEDVWWALLNSNEFILDH